MLCKAGVPFATSPLFVRTALASQARCHWNYHRLVCTRWCHVRCNCTERLNLRDSCCFSLGCFSGQSLTPCIPRIRCHFRLDKDPMQRATHLRLWVGAVLLLVCGVVWTVENPLANVLTHMRTTVDVADIIEDTPADYVARSSRPIGLAIFSILSLLLLGLSFGKILRVERRCQQVVGGRGFASKTQQLEEDRHLLAGRQQRSAEEETMGRQTCSDEWEELQTSWKPAQWYPLVAFAMCESTSAVAFLAFSFWRKSHGDVDLGLGGDASFFSSGNSYARETTSTFFFHTLVADLDWTLLAHLAHNACGPVYLHIQP